MCKYTGSIWKATVRLRHEPNAFAHAAVYVSCSNIHMYTYY